MDNLRSTFPLDEAAIGRRALRQILTDPITWAPLVPPVAAYTIFDVPTLLSLGVGVLIVGGVGAYWSKQWAGITDGWRRQAVREHNRQQDELLQAAVAEFHAAQESDFAQTLEQFVRLKRSVEARLHEDGQLTPQKIQLEQLIDSLCFGVRDQLQGVLLREQKGHAVDRAATLAQVDDAFRTLQSTIAELDNILGPTVAPLGSNTSSIEEITRRLREETEIARRVQARLRAQAEPGAAPAVETPRRESE